MHVERDERSSPQLGGRAIHQVEMMGRDMLRTRIKGERPHAVERGNIRQSSIVADVGSRATDDLGLHRQIVPGLQQVVDAMYPSRHVRLQVPVIVDNEPGLSSTTSVIAVTRVRSRRTKSQFSSVCGNALL